MKTLREWIRWAEQRKVAIGHFNISDSEGFNAITEVAEELGLPVIIGVSEGERSFLGIEEAVALVHAEQARGKPVFINADHTYSVEKAKKVIDADFDAVIIDGADKNFEENIKQTKEVVQYAQTHGAIVEGELGFIGQSSKVLEKIPEGVSEETQTKPEDARKFVKETGVELLAPSVGNVHGMIKQGNPKLNIELISKIRSAAGVPLVLHGGSGISEKDFISAINAGISIVHINTELRLAYKEGIKEGIESKEVAPYKFLAKGVDEMKEVVRGKLKLFNKLKS